MSFQAMGWAFGLKEIGPLSKLIAIRLGDSCHADGTGKIELTKLAEWCSTDARSVLAGMESLHECGVTWRFEGKFIEYELPSSVQMPDGSRINELAEEKLTLYVVSGRIGIKIGITRTLMQRIEAIVRATADDTICLLFSFVGPASAIRRAEAAAHRSLAVHLIRNEWFNTSAYTALAAVEEALKEVDK